MCIGDSVLGAVAFYMILTSISFYKNKHARETFTRLRLSHLHMNINPKGTSFTTVGDLVEVDNT